MYIVKHFDLDYGNEEGSFEEELIMNCISLSRS